jgi:protoporphyrinogen oxidase
MSHPETTILGAGLSGLSASFHLGHKSCVIFEKSLVSGGHAGSQTRFGFTFDHGPHVSFTRHEYVRELFRKNVEDCFLEFPVRTSNYFQGTWIDHPAQAHLWQIPDHLRDRCAMEMMAAAGATYPSPPRNYQEWLDQSFGTTFAATFPSAYTRKYWTTEPANLSIDWLGPRMARLQPQELKAGLIHGTRQNLHYITKVRYPEYGGYQSFYQRMTQGANIRFGAEIAAVDLTRRQLFFADGTSRPWEKLISTLPLTDFIAKCRNVPSHVEEAAAVLDCSQLLIVDVFAPQVQSIPGHWFYVYDENKWSTRIHCIERLSSSNAPEGWTGIQVEIYFSRHRPLEQSPGNIATKVAEELVEMGFLDAGIVRENRAHIQWRWSPYANIIFTHPRRQALEVIWKWLESHGLERENDDLEPNSEWEVSCPAGSLAMAGRFAQWKYFWTDDCILRGRQLAGGAGRDAPSSQRAVLK